MEFIAEEVVKEEVHNFIHTLKKYLPKAKDIKDMFFKKTYLRLSHIHEKSKSVFPNCFLGAKIVAVREITDNVRLSQQYDYAVPKNTYRSFSHYLYKEMQPKSEKGFVIDTCGSATATYEENLDDIGLTITSKILHLMFSETEVCFDKGDKTRYGSLSFSIKDVDAATLKVVTQYLKKVSKSVYLGMEIRSCPLSTLPYPELAICGLYDTKNLAISGTATQRGFQLCFFKQLNHGFKAASIVDMGLYRDNVTSSIALQKDFKHNIMVKAFIDTNRCGGLTVEKNLYLREYDIELRVLKLIGSVLIDPRRKVDFGIGFYLNM